MSRLPQSPQAGEDAEAFGLHPDNPRYFIYKGRPVVLIAATEHYGAVSNAAFDCEAYLGMLREHGFNLTRLVLLLRETEREFKGLLGRQNTLAPSAEDYIGPWARSGTPGALDGGAKFDLDVWNEPFFDRLKDFCRKAEEWDIVVEVTLFSQLYSDKADSPWTLSPFHPANNVNGIAASGFNRFTALDNEPFNAKQEAFVRKVAAELSGFGNVYYEICNEPPYPPAGTDGELPADHPSAAGERAISEWQNAMAAAIVDEESKRGCRHPIAVGDPQEHIDFGLFSMYNFHYREWMEQGINRLYGHGKPICFDETLTGIVSWNTEMDFRGRRMEAWEFMMRGCGVYDYLDFTIATDDPRGEGNAEFPGGRYYDGTAMRAYLKILKDFMDGIDFVRMAPDEAFASPSSASSRAFALADRGRAYAVYMTGSGAKYVTVRLPEGTYRAQWFDPLTGACVGRTEAIAGGGDMALALPPYHDDLALKLTAE